MIKNAQTTAKKTGSKKLTVAMFFIVPVELRKKLREIVAIRNKNRFKNGERPHSMTSVIIELINSEHEKIK